MLANVEFLGDDQILQQTAYKMPTLHMKFPAKIETKDGNNYF